LRDRRARPYRSRTPKQGRPFLRSGHSRAKGARFRLSVMGTARALERDILAHLVIGLLVIGLPVESTQRSADMCRRCLPPTRRLGVNADAPAHALAKHARDEPRQYAELKSCAFEQKRMRCHASERVNELLQTGSRRQRILILSGRRLITASFCERAEETNNRHSRKKRGRQCCLPAR
jgi:hypothetical protein